MVEDVEYLSFEPLTKGKRKEKEKRYRYKEEEGGLSPKKMLDRALTSKQPNLAGSNCLVSL